MEATMMQCPNCGRHIRSKNQCAHCGYQFDGSEAKIKDRKQPIEETESSSPEEIKSDELVARPTESVLQEDQSEEPIVDSDLNDYDTEYEKPSAIRSVGRGVWNVVKVLLTIVIVFLLFFFGPGLIRDAMDYFNIGSNQQQGENIVDAPEASIESNQIATESADENQTSPTTEEVEEEPGIQLVENTVNLDDYPMIQVRLAFSESLGDIERDDFNFQMETNGSQTPLDDYAISKTDKELVISFNDPAINLLSTGPTEQTLKLTSPKLGIEETLSYTLPNVSVDQEKAQQFDELVTENIVSYAKVTALFSNAQTSDVPLVYDQQSLEAGNLITWFVLENVFDQIEAGDLNLQDTVTVNASLIAQGDAGTVASANDDATFTIDELIRLIVQENDISAINHLIQATGGPNAFNTWLNESNYFATNINQQLAVSSSGAITGVVTSVQDLNGLLTKLANNQLVSAETDALIKEYLLQTPMTDKYPSVGISAVERRFEIASSDANSQQQYYASIIETANTSYIAVFMAYDINDLEATRAGMSSTLSQLVSLYETGELTAEEPESVPEPVVNQPETVPTQETPEYIEQYVENTGERVYLPARGYYNEAGEYIQPTWYWNEATQSYQYSFE